MNKNEDEVQLIEETPEDVKSNRKSMIGWIIFFSVMVVLMATCVIVIKVLGD